MAFNYTLCCFPDINALKKHIVLQLYFLNPYIPASDISEAMSHCHLHSWPLVFL
jgi:hypothetical protein